VLVFAAWHVALAEGQKASKRKRLVLPAAAAAAVKKAFPKASIEEVEREEVSLALYEVEIEQGDSEAEITVTSDGQIVEVEKEVAASALPKAVAMTLKKLAGGAKVEEIERVEVHAVLKLVKLAKVKVVYEAEFVRDGKEVEVRIGADGKLLATVIDDDEDDDDDDGEDGKDISLDQVPAAVKATILAHAGKNKIKELEVKTRRGRKVYEVEWEADGKETKIKVAFDGKLLAKKVKVDDD